MWRKLTSTNFTQNTVMAGWCILESSLTCYFRIKAPTMFDWVLNTSLNCPGIYYVQRKLLKLNYCCRLLVADILTLLSKLFMNDFRKTIEITSEYLPCLFGCLKCVHVFPRVPFFKEKLWNKRSSFWSGIPGFSRFELKLFKMKMYFQIFCNIWGFK